MDVAPMHAQRRQLLLFAALGALTACLPACRGEVAGLAQGDRFPVLALPYLDSSKGLFEDDATAPLVVNFWASWCEPCRREMPSLEKLGALFHPGELQVIGVAVDSDVNLAREFSLRYRLTFPVLSDNGMALSNGVLHIPAFPMTYLLRQDRTVASVIIGERDWAAPGMVAQIEELLAVRHRQVSGSVSLYNQYNQNEVAADS